MTKDTTHLESLQLLAYRAEVYLSKAKNQLEKDFYRVNLNGLNKQIKEEYARLGSDYSGEFDNLSDDELLKELGV